MGLGYVGLPLAYEATTSGLQVTGFDVDSEVVLGLNSGVSHVDDVSNSQVQEMIEAGFNATTDPKAIADSDVIVICVPTPLTRSSSRGSVALALIEKTS